MSWLFVSALSLTFASGSAFGGGGGGGMRVVRGEDELNGVAGSCPIRSYPIVRCLSDLQRRGTQLAAQSFILGVHRVMLHVRSVVM